MPSLRANDTKAKYLKKPIDITAIQINQNQIKDIIYLKCDWNYKDYGYNHYINNDIISLGYPNIYGLASGSGKIKEIDKYEFYHNIPTKKGSSGSPIILY